MLMMMFFVFAEAKNGWCIRRIRGWYTWRGPVDYGILCKQEVGIYVKKLCV